MRLHDVAMAGRLVQAADVVQRDLDGQLLLLRHGSSDVLHLDEVASRVWAHVAEPIDRDELVRRLAAEHDEDPAVIAADLEPALEVLRRHGLVLDVL